MTSPRSVAAMVVIAVGVAVVLAGLFGLAESVAATLGDILHPGRRGYGLLLLPPASFICGVVVIAGLALTLAGRRLMMTARLRPSAPPPG